MPSNREAVRMVAVTLLLSSVACSLIGDTTAIPTTHPTPRRPTPTAPLPTVTPSAPPGVPTRELSPTGPWIVLDGAGGLSDRRGIWAMNEDGTGLSLLTDHLPISRIVPAPTGGLVAYTTEEPATDPDSRGAVTLHIYSIPRRAEIASLQVSEAVVTDPDDPEWWRTTGAVEAAAGYYGSPLAWSPDGTRLAFVGIIDGETADLYSYSIETGRVVRLSFGSSQAYQPTWSPDGKYIVHFGVDSFGSGAGYSMDEAWSVSANGSSVTALPDMNLGSDVWFLGWEGEGPTFYSAPWGASCGLYGLQMVNAVTGKAVDLLRDYLPDAAATAIVATAIAEGRMRGFVSDVSLDKRGAGLLYITTEECEGVPTLMAFQPGQEPRPIPVEGAIAVAWLRETRTGHESLAVVLTDHGQFLITTNGEILPVNPPPEAGGLPSQIAGTDILMWTGPGLWLGSLTDPQAAPVKVFEGHVYSAVPSVDGDHIVIYSGDLWVVSSSDGYQPLFVSEWRSQSLPLRVEP